MEDKFLPCPFCGCETIVTTHYATASCIDCGSEAAVPIWNTRAQTSVQEVETVTADKKEIIGHVLYESLPKVSFQHIVIILDGLQKLYPNGIRIVNDGEG